MMAKSACAPESGLEIRSEITAHSNARACCEQLEAGQILYFPQTPLAISKSDREFLLSQQQADSSLHKNISYRPNEDVLRGFAAKNPDDVARLHGILAQLLATGDAVAHEAARAVCLAMEARFRQLPADRRAKPRPAAHPAQRPAARRFFPTRPTHGSRILRFFTNINPTQPRVWLTSMRFPDIARNFARAAGLEHVAADEKSVSRLRGAAVRRLTSRRGNAGAGLLGLRPVHAPLP